MKKVLITGITGLVGSAFAVRMLKKAKDLRFLAVVRGNKNISAAKRVYDTIEEQCRFDGIPELSREFINRIDVLESDIVNPVHLAMAREIKDISAVFHCAADVNLGADANGHTYRVNYNGTKVLLDIAKELNVGSFHYVSTAYVAGKLTGIVKEEESPSCEWKNVYERSKCKAEKLVIHSGLPYMIYRPSIIVGRLSDGRIRKPLAFYYILDFLGMLKERMSVKQHTEVSQCLNMPLRIQADTKGLVYFVPVDYVVNCIGELFSGPVLNEIYHITGNYPISTRQIETAVTKALNVKSVRIVDYIDEPTSDEKLFHRFLGEFLPYFGSLAEFDTSNLQKRLGKEAVSLKIDNDALFNLITKYYKERFPELISDR